MIVHSPDGLVIPGRRRGLVEHIDLFATILELAGLGGSDLPEGSKAESLAPALQGDPFVGKEYAVSERCASDVEWHLRRVRRLEGRQDWVKRLLGPGGVDSPHAGFFDDLVLSQIRISHEDGESVAVQSLDKKIIVRSELPDLVFDLAKDPKEAHDLSTADPLTHGEHRRIASRHLEMIAEFMAAGRPQIDPEIRKQLEALGYFR